MNDQMKVLIIGNGGPWTCPLSWKTAESSQVEKIFVGARQMLFQHGNKVGKKRQYRCADIDALVAICQKRRPIDLTIVGPEATVVIGVVDGVWEQKGWQSFGQPLPQHNWKALKPSPKDFLGNVTTFHTAAYGNFTEVAACCGLNIKQKVAAKSL